MNMCQKGMTGLQVLITIAAIAVLGTISIPKYQSFMDKARLTEAFNLAHESKRRVSEFYNMNSRFPASESEAQSLKTRTVTPPEYVQDMSVLATGEEEVVIKVFLKPDAVENVGSEEQFVFIEMRRSAEADHQLEWRCGAIGNRQGNTAGKLPGLISRQIWHKVCQSKLPHRGGLPGPWPETPFAFPWSFPLTIVPGNWWPACRRSRLNFRTMPRSSSCLMVATWTCFPIYNHTRLHFGCE